MTSLLVLGFADRRDAAGRYQVSDSSGAVVATIEKRWASNRFVAYDAAGGPLCEGGLRIMGPWAATDRAGAALASISRGAFGQHRVVLGDGRWQGYLRGRFFGRDWSMTGEDGTVVVSAVPHRAGWIFAPDDWLVQSKLTLAETVAVAELHRLDVKRGRRNSG